VGVGFVCCVDFVLLVGFFVVGCGFVFEVYGGLCYVFLLFGILYCWSAFYAPEGFCWLLELGFVVMSECRQ
jgi:hypothetical protein